MASALYNSYKQSLLDSTCPDLSSETDITCTLIDTGVYTFLATHDFEDDLTGEVGTPGVLTSTTITDGVFDAADEVYTSVSGASVEALVIWQDTGGAPSTDPLIAYIDGFTAVTPNGGDITVVWDSGANKIFAF